MALPLGSEVNMYSAATKALDVIFIKLKTQQRVKRYRPPLFK